MRFYLTGGKSIHNMKEKMLFPHRSLLRKIRQKEVHGEDLISVFSHHGYTVLDLETTGLGEDITEIGWVSVSEQGQIEQAESHLVMPEGLMTQQVIEITGITPEMVIDKPAAGEVLPVIHEALQGKLLVGHSIGVSDLVILNDNFILHGLSPLFDSFADTYDLARSLYKKGEVPGFSVKSLSRYFSIPLFHYHRALEDCKAEYYLFRALLHEYDKREKSIHSDTY